MADSPTNVVSHDRRGRRGGRGEGDGRWHNVRRKQRGRKRTAVLHAYQHATSRAPLLVSSPTFRPIYLLRRSIALVDFFPAATDALRHPGLHRRCQLTSIIYISHDQSFGYRDWLRFPGNLHPASSTFTAIRPETVRVLHYSTAPPIPPNFPSSHFRWPFFFRFAKQFTYARRLRPRRSTPLFGLPRASSSP
jgi:hypothetical protein